MNKALRVDVVSSSLIYIGESAPGAPDTASIWRISRIDISGGQISIKFAGGNTAWNSIWDDRASLTYS